MQVFEDVVIIGGGVIAASIAYFLQSSDSFAGSVLVIETEFDNNNSSWDIFHQQFSLPENMQMAQFAQEFLAGLNRFLRVEDNPVNVNYRENGYLFLVEDRDIPILYNMNSLHQQYGASVSLLDPEDLARGFPWLNNSDLAGGSLGLAGEGGLNAGFLRAAFREKARSLGVRFQTGELVDIAKGKNRVNSTTLSSGQTISFNMIINAAGTDSARIAHMAGINLPMEARKRQTFSFSSKVQLEESPVIVDPTGVHFRQDRNLFYAGYTSPRENDPSCVGTEIDYDVFEEHIWPVLSHRIPSFQKITMEKALSEHDTVNVFDQSPVLGSHPVLTNFYFANGFMGRSAQASPAVGRAIAELIDFGGYRTLDLSRFSFDRMVTGEAILEHTVLQ
ncbi:FAD-binding oxidoreductase [Sneathiella marina]|uniref:FAD-binding oxidoreductase n=1 Tax=Sneathiella marina TaxID=2950108 RepID=A0ABY4W260_9PROT|nr:FAD-binding oxidoreductase [Sneathiella marina]USG61029.1 FAD-binding oxidoreductase [Sneathiella marina]